MKIITKNNHVSGSTSTPTLEVGELAIDTHNPKLWFNNGTETKGFGGATAITISTLPTPSIDDFGKMYRVKDTGNTYLCNSRLLSPTLDSDCRWIQINTSTTTIGRGVFAGGYWENNNITSVIDCITIDTLGNASMFGDLSARNRDISATSNGTNGRGVFGGGWDYVGDDDPWDVIDYITISTACDATNFGSLTTDRCALTSTSNTLNERGVFAGGKDDSDVVDTIDYITISTLGDATDFGDLYRDRSYLAGTSNATNDRGVFAGGDDDGGGEDDTIDYITISTTGNASNFGDLYHDTRYLSGTSNATNDRGVFAGGDDGGGEVDRIDYITISTTGDSYNFGDLSDTLERVSATSNGVDERGVFAGGSDGETEVNAIDYITISTTGNATDFGDLTFARDSMAATSDA